MHLMDMRCQVLFACEGLFGTAFAILMKAEAIFLRSTIQFMHFALVPQKTAAVRESLELFAPLSTTFI